MKKIIITKNLEPKEEEIVGWVKLSDDFHGQVLGIINGFKRDGISPPALSLNYSLCNNEIVCFNITFEPAKKG